MNVVCLDVTKKCGCLHVNYHNCLFFYFTIDWSLLILSSWIIIGCIWRLNSLLLMTTSVVFFNYNFEGLQLCLPRCGRGHYLHWSSTVCTWRNPKHFPLFLVASRLRHPAWVIYVRGGTWRSTHSRIPFYWWHLQKQNWQEWLTKNSCYCNVIQGCQGDITSNER